MTLSCQDSCFLRPCLRTWKLDTQQRDIDHAQSHPNCTPAVVSHLACLQLTKKEKCARFVEVPFLSFLYKSWATEQFPCKKSMCRPWSPLWLQHCLSFGGRVSAVSSFSIHEELLLGLESLAISHLLLLVIFFSFRFSLFQSFYSPDIANFFEKLLHHWNIRMCVYVCERKMQVSMQVCAYGCMHGEAGAGCWLSSSVIHLVV